MSRAKDKKHNSEVWVTAKGRCEVCGVDIIELETIRAMAFGPLMIKYITKPALPETHVYYRKIVESLHRFQNLAFLEWMRLIHEHNIPEKWHQCGSSLGQVDHITPCYEGGAGSGIENLRLVCVMCHQKISQDQAESRAAIKRHTPRKK